MSEMETKTQVQNLIIQESLLTCIDLANSDLHQSVLLLKQACLDSGFLINHGISEEVMDKAFEKSKKFFAFPLEEKMKVLKNKKHRGYIPLYDQIPDPENQVQGTCNQFLTSKKFVECSQIIRDTFFFILKGITKKVTTLDPKRICKAIAKLLALALDLDADYFDSPEMLGKPISTLRLLHYEVLREIGSLKGNIWNGAHSDYKMMTLIATDGVLGLQICKDRNAKPQKWEYVPSIEGYNMIMFNFRYTLIPFFLEPNHDCIIECLPTCQSENNLPKFPAIKCWTHLTQRYEEVHSNFRSYEKHA
ncbi:hypothetical protein Bca52824_017214 [Brassica carinata]|uniref:Non-haem dioxygenase N-terminal domain-containing protein n=1 Tax=Brassica carinata TaxID=52824 RepID=A0A8X8AX28_BRACI|nr:hypothetical protein Bca52824_017214 [Brassica carinata]